MAKRSDFVMLDGQHSILAIRYVIEAGCFKNLLEIQPLKSSQGGMFDSHGPRADQLQGVDVNLMKFLIIPGGALLPLLIFGRDQGRIALGHGFDVFGEGHQPQLPRKNIVTKKLPKKFTRRLRMHPSERVVPVATKKKAARKPPIQCPPARFQPRPSRWQGRRRLTRSL